MVVGKSDFMTFLLFSDILAVSVRGRFSWMHPNYSRPRGIDLKIA